jgi:hypothetical protein
MHGMVVVTMRGMRVMSGLFVGASVVVLGSLLMVLRSVLVVFGCLTMMLCGLLGHNQTSFDAIRPATQSRHLDKVSNGAREDSMTVLDRWC